MLRAVLLSIRECFANNEASVRSMVDPGLGSLIEARRTLADDVEAIIQRALSAKEAGAFDAVEQKLKAQRSLVQAAHAAFHAWAETKPASDVGTFHPPEAGDDPAEQMRIIIRWYERHIPREPTMTIEQRAQKLYEAYNSEGPNPWKSVRGDAIPQWSELTGAIGEQVRAKWLATARASVDREEKYVRHDNEREG